jgi:hypothetical protein
VNTSETTVEPRSGLLNVVDIVVAPQAAFARLRVVPTWGWAFLAASLLGIAGTLLAAPANLHAWEQYAPAIYAQVFQNLDPAQRETAIQRAVQYGHVIQQLGWIAIPIVLLVATLIQALILLVANAIGRGDGTFARFYALVMTCAVVGSGVGLLLAGLIAVIRGPAAYDTPTAVQAAVPGLALLAPGAGPKLLAFLTVINVTSVWSMVLLALGMIAVANVSRVVAWVTSAFILLATAAVVAASTR